jgi:hypothetical protein
MFKKNPSLKLPHLCIKCLKNSKMKNIYDSYVDYLYSELACESPYYINDHILEFLYLNRILFP